MLFNSNLPSLVLVKAEWCGHCQHFKPIWEQIGGMIPKDKMNVVTLDSEKDKAMISNIKTISGFPSIYYVPSKGKGNAMMYGGLRDFISLVDYINNAYGSNLINV